MSSGIVSGTIDELCDVRYGTRVTKKVDAGTKYPVYGGGGETFRIDQCNRSDCLVVSRFGMSPECTRFVAGEFFLNDSGLTVHTNDPDLLWQPYLDKYILSLNNTIYALGRGSAQKNLNVDAFRSIQLTLPPLVEQKRIVAILDEAFEAIERAEEATQAAFTPLEYLVQREREALLRGCEGTTDARLGEHIDLLAGPAFKSASYTDDPSGVRLLRGDNIVPGSTRWDGLKRWPADDTSAYEKYCLQVDDVVIAMDRPWISTGFKRAMLTDEDIPSLLVQRVARLRCLDTMCPRFLYHLISSTSFIEQMIGGQTGTGVPHISGKQIEAFKFTCPKVDRQRDIAERLDGIIEFVQNAVEIHHRKLAMLRSLRASLLGSAFNGELGQARGVPSKLSEALA